MRIACLSLVATFSLTILACGKGDNIPPPPLSKLYADTIAGSWNWHHWTNSWSGSTTQTSYLGDTIMSVKIQNDTMIEAFGYKLLYSPVIYHSSFVRGRLTEEVNTNSMLYYLDTNYQGEHQYRTFILYLLGDSAKFITYSGGLGGGGSDYFTTKMPR